MVANHDNPATIRSFGVADQAACQELYEQGLIGGKLSENDTAADIDNIIGEYMKSGNHFWVAEADGPIVGMIGVQHHDYGTRSSVETFRAIQVSPLPDEDVRG